MRKNLVAFVLIFAFLAAGIPARGQDLVPVSDITGGSSVFVFRGSQKSAPKKFVSKTKSTRSKAQRIESAKKFSKQYATIAKTTPFRARATIVDPNRLPTAVRTMPREQASKLFAGVGEYYIDRDDLANAVEFFREAVTLDARNANAKTGLSEALALKGNDLLAKDNIPAARKLFEESIKFNPNSAAAHFGLGEIYADANDSAKAIASYEKAREHGRNLTEIYSPLGILYYQNGQIDKADQLLSQAMAADPNSAETQYFLGLIRYAQNRNDEALTAFRRARTIDPDYAEAYYYAGETLSRQGKNEGSIEEFNRATSLKPNYFEAKMGLGNAYYEMENYKEAIRFYTEATRLKNDSSEAYANLGDAYRQEGNFNEAEAKYNLAAIFAERGTNFSSDEKAEVYSKRGFVIARQCELNMRRALPCKWDVAIANFEKAAALSESNVDYANLGWAYFNAGHIDVASRRPTEGRPKLEKAKINLQKSLAGSNSKFADASLVNLGATQIDLGEYPTAIQSLKRVVDKRSDWIFASYALGTAYFKNNEYDNAAKSFKKVLDKESNYVPALASLGYTYIELKKKSEVEKIIEKLRRLNPGEASKLRATMISKGMR